MSYTEYYFEFIQAQKNEDAKYVMFGADIKGSRLLTPEQDKERQRLIKEMDFFVKNVNGVPMSRTTKEGIWKWLCLGDSFLFAVKATDDLVEVEKKFTQFLATFPLEFHRGKARFDIATVEERDEEWGLTWYYCWPFLEDMMKIKENL